MRWRAFRLAEREFDLSHLDDLSFQFITAAKDRKSELRYQIDVIFGLHCFTKKLDSSLSSYSSDLEYSDARETRLFDYERYDLSKHLPAIIPQIGKCFHAFGNGNFYLTKALEIADKKVTYFIYFKLSRGSGQRLNLFVSSAYVPTAESQPSPRERKPIGFGVIAYNISHGLPIKRPR